MANLSKIQQQLDATYVLEACLKTTDAISNWTRLQLARFQWLHSKVLAQAPEPRAAYGPPLANKMADIYKSVQHLTGLQATFRQACDHFGQLEASIAQRLNWASGANRGLGSVLDGFNEGARARQIAVFEDAKTCAAIIGTGTAVVHFETFRLHKGDSPRVDDANKTLVSSYKELLESLEMHTNDVTKLLQSLPEGVKNIAPHGRITKGWIAFRLAELPGVLRSIRGAAARASSALPSLHEPLRAIVASTRDLTTDTQALIGELAPLLTAVAQENGDPSACTLAKGYEQFIGDLNEFLDAVPLLLSDTLLVEPTMDGAGDDTLRNIALELWHGESTMLQTFAGVTQNLHEQLLSLQLSLVSIDDEPEDPPDPSTTLAVEGDPTLADPSERAKPPRPRKPLANGKSSKIQQEKNAHAVSVWKRVRTKLEGRVGEAGKKRTIGEQVEMVIREATHPDNLCVMYEGWTPWV